VRRPKMWRQQFNLNELGFHSFRWFDVCFVDPRVTGRSPLARISHQLATAAADTGMSAALRSVGRLDVLSSTPAEPSGRAPSIHARLHRLATKPGEKCGLGHFASLVTESSWKIGEL
jgi:hypothetical protein